MGWRLLGKPKTVPATKALAKQFVEMDPAPHDRPLSERRLAVYERLLNDGAFRPVTWATAICTETGGLYRVNGKHTSTLLAGRTKVDNFFVTVEEYECDTLEDVARLYSTFDSKMQSRSAKDIYTSFAATVTALADISPRIISIAVSGMSYHLGHEDKSAAERAELLLEYPEFVTWLNELFTSGQEDRGSVGERKNSKHIQRQGVAAAMFGTWQKSHKDATAFWSAVRDGSGHPQTVPDRKLEHYLLTTAVFSGHGVFHTRTATTREIYVKSIHSWNAWRKQESTNLRYHADAPVPAIR